MFATKQLEQFLASQCPSEQHCSENNFQEITRLIMYPQCWCPVFRTPTWAAITVLIETVPLSFTFHRKLYPFHVPTERLLLKVSPEKPLKILG